MPKRNLKRLTANIIEKTRPPQVGRKELADGIVPGLVFRISSTGARSFVLSYRCDGHQNRVVLGRYPETGLAEARRLAEQIIESKGQSAKQVLGRPEDKNEDDEDAPLTFGALYELWTRRGQVHLSGPRAGQPHANAARARRLIEKYVLPKWGSRPVEEIRKRDAARLLAKVSEHSGSTSIYLHHSLGSLFGWAIKNDEIEHSPIWKLPLPAARVERDRVLSDAELAAVWRTADELGTPWRQWIRLLILTGCRRGEIAGLRWDEIDFEGRVINLPASRTKSARAHTVHLSDLALAELESLPENPGEFAVSCTNGRLPVSGFGKVKATFDGLLGFEERERWTWHDIRRTFRSGLAALGIAPAVAEKIVNHATGNALMRIYDRHTYAGEMAEALDRWAAHVRDLVEPPPGNVVPMNQKASRQRG